MRVCRQHALFAQTAKRLLLRTPHWTSQAIGVGSVVFSSLRFLPFLQRRKTGPEGGHVKFAIDTLPKPLRCIVSLRPVCTLRKSTLQTTLGSDRRFLCISMPAMVKSAIDRKPVTRTNGSPPWQYGLASFDALHRAVLSPMRKQLFRSLHWWCLLLCTFFSRIEQPGGSLRCIKHEIRCIPGTDTHNTI